MQLNDMLTEVELHATHKEGGEDVTDFDLLKQKMDESGMTMVAIAEQSGIRRETLYNRLKGIGDFTASEMTGLSRSLKLNKRDRDAIFFAPKVE